LSGLRFVRRTGPEAGWKYDNESVANVKLFLGADGRLTELLSQLNIETTELYGTVDFDQGKSRGFGFIEMSADTAVDQRIRALDEETNPVKSANPNTTGPSKRGKLTLAGSRRRGDRSEGVSASLLAHAVETFGSAQRARRWLSSECGALNNRTPLQVIQGAGHEAAVERILDCIDHGMMA
jgi:hypothetical protein